MSDTAPDVTLRPDEAADLEFLRGLYIVSRWQEMAEEGLPEDERAEFLTWQFFQQRDHLAAIGAEVWLIEAEGAPAGRLVVRDQPGVLVVLDLLLLPLWQGRGVDGAVLAMARQRAEEDGVALMIADPADTKAAAAG